MKSIRAYLVALSLALAVVFVFSVAARASVKAQGPGAFVPDVFTGCAGCTLLASDTTTATSTNGILTFTLVAAVYADPGNIFGAGDLDFVYQVSNSATSTDSI